MGYIVMVYGAEGYEEFVLPKLDNSDHGLLLERRIFGIHKDLPVLMEVVDGRWNFVKNRAYVLTAKDGSSGFEKSLKEGMVLYLKDRTGSRITLVVLCGKESFPVFQKYDLRNIDHLMVGKETGCGIVYDFLGYISRNHAVLFRYEGRWAIQDISSNGSYLNGKRIQGQAFLSFGDKITIFGLRMIFLMDCLALCALTGDCHVDEEQLPRCRPRNGLLLPELEPENAPKDFFKRSPRIVEKLYTEKIEIEGPPQLAKAKKRPLLLTIGPSMTMAIPMLLGCLMAVLSARSRGGTSGIYMFTGAVTAVSSAVIGVLWALTNLRYAGKEEEENEELRYNAYGQYLIDITEFIKQKYDESREILYRTYLSGRECCQFGSRDERLWNRNPRQEDFLTVRLGTGTVPFQAEIAIPKAKFTMIRDDLADRPAMIRDSYQDLRSVPVCMDIWKKGLVGIVGGPGKRGAYAVVRNMIAQLAANNCYTEVKMVFIYEQNPETSKIWSFAKWLPHVWMEDRKTRLIAGNKSELGDICYEMSRVIQIRTEEQNQKKEYPLPHFVIFADSLELLQGELLERFLYSPRPEYGITTVLLAEKYSNLPNSCEEIIQNDGTASRFFHVYDDERQSRDLVFDEVDEEELEQLARRLCGTEVHESLDSGEIPGALTFFEMYGVSTLDQLHVLERWKKNRNYENMRVPIGQKAGGNTCYLDIHEKYHGPHGLVAGTTGSGKSETLQTYILSLAVNFSPDDIAFFIIDFKGGGMANLFSGLPHMAGQISNLSGNQVRRAMISITSENTRRQRIFAEHNVNNINLYTRLYKNHEAALPIPHLFIIIDEFAELKREEPEFMKELISVAQVGRSLGVHLILSTQKPSGTVDDNIWSNSKFRLCLRVQDRQDSNDMLHKPDAAYITQAGRGYLQVGNDEIYEQFQSGYSGAEYVEDSKQNRSASAVMMTLTGRPAMTGKPAGKKHASAAESRTQLNAVIGYLNQMAKKHHYDRRMLLWLPVLPKELYLEELKREQEPSRQVQEDRWSLETVVGLYDDPVNQAQKPLKVSFLEGGHLAVCGTVATGKSTFLQTLLYGMIQNYDPQELNFYVLDYSSRMLLPFAEAPHCGGVIVDTDEDKVKRFFHMLGGIMEERKSLFGGGDYSQYIRSGRGKGTMPAVLVVIDNYANFREKTNSQFDDFMLRLSREGVGYGIFLAVASGGLGSGEIPSRVGDNIRTVLSLEMGDKFKYAEVLRVSRVEIMPETDVKGRGLARVEGSILEFQTALSVRAKDAYERSEMIRECGIKMSEAWKGRKARKIPVIPLNPSLSDLQELEEYISTSEGRRYLPVGYLEQDASMYSVDLWNTYCYLIQGRSRSGKKNVLKLLLHGASRKPDARVCLIDLNGQELKKTAERLQVEYLTEEREVYDFFKSTVPVFQERNRRKQELMIQGLEGEELAEQMNQEQQVFIFLADIPSFVQMAYRQLEGVGSIHAYLENITEKGSFHGFYFFGILNPEYSSSVSGYRTYQNMISYRTGMHLGGNVSAQRLFQFSNIPFQEQAKVTKPGIALVPSADDPGAGQKIVIPLDSGRPI